MTMQPTFAAASTPWPAGSPRSEATTFVVNRLVQILRTELLLLSQDPRRKQWRVQHRIDLVEGESQYFTLLPNRSNRVRQ